MRIQLILSCEIIELRNNGNWVQQQQHANTQTQDYNHAIGGMVSGKYLNLKNRIWGHHILVITVTEFKDVIHHASTTMMTASILSSPKGKVRRCLLRDLPAYKKQKNFRWDIFTFIIKNVFWKMGPPRAELLNVHKTYCSYTTASPRNIFWLVFTTTYHLLIQFVGLCKITE